VKLIFGFKSNHLSGNEDWEYAESHPLGGAETALLRMATALRDSGHEVELVNYPSTTNEIRELMSGKACDVFINSRTPAGILALSKLPGKVNYYWAHDDADQPLLAPLKQKPEWRAAFYQRLNGLFLLSRYQRSRWLAELGLALEKTHLITNPIPFQRFQTELAGIRSRGPRAYYASTPFRGLSYLLDGWPLVRQRVPNAEVHVFSSLRVNGAEETPESEELYRRAQQTPGVVYRGAVSQSILRQEAQHARVLAYPCCFPETSCIVAMEAMAAGAVVVATELGALPETAWQNPMQPAVKGWLERWASDVARQLTDDDEYEARAKQNVELARRYDAEVVAQSMTRVFQRDLGPSARSE
jgi:glycosyltransferase involved in cell wall biosynthesis